MKNVTVMLFAGTTEGRRLCGYLAEKSDTGFITHVYVTTEYGKEIILELSENIYKEKLHIHVGRLDEEAMQKELAYIKPDIVIDATHPYARVVTRSIKDVCDKADVQYIRVLREETVPKAAYEDGASLDDRLVYTDTMQETVSILNSKAYLRLLPDPCMLQNAIDAGFFPAHLIAMQGPFSTEINAALIRQFHIDVLVTKESGNSGGYNEKLMAAEQIGADVVVIKRPVEHEGKCIKEVIEYLEKL